ncbi:MAG: transglutaminase domain-containing protein [Rhodoluna sp.]
MSRFRITHKTGFKYSLEVSASYNEARLLPARDDRQFVISSKLDISPQCPSHEYFDYFKSRAVQFEILQPHDELTISATSLVEIRESIRPIPGLNWDDLAPEIVISLELTDAISQTRRTQPPAELAKYAKKISSQLAPHEAAIDICKKVYSAMTYKHGVTGVHSIATEAWSAKIGVCQDYAHVTLGILRAAGIPARYVSGYLHPHIEPKIGEKVTGESHAWVEWWAGSWYGYDPTNDIEIGERHIVVASGRDYDDVAPLRGVYAGASESELFVTVEITKES